MKGSSWLAIVVVAGSMAMPAFGQQAATGAPQPKVTFVQSGLAEIAGPRVNEAVAAGIQKITATPGKGNRSIEVRSPWGNIYFGWPNNVKPVAFSLESSKKAGVVTVSAPGFTEANRADYKAAIEAVVPMAISKAQAQKDGRTRS